MAEENILESRVSGTQSGYPIHQRVPRLTVRNVVKEQQAGLHCIDSRLLSFDALRALAEKNIKAAVVLDGQRMVGIFSLQDFARTTLIAGMSAMTVPVLNVMTLCNCQAALEDSAQSCLHLMQEKHLDLIPVQDSGHLIALLSREDLLTQMVLHYEKIFRESALDQQILFLRGTYSC